MKVAELIDDLLKIEGDLPVTIVLKGGSMGSEWTGWMGTEYIVEVSGIVVKEGDDFAALTELDKKTRVEIIFEDED